MTKTTSKFLSRKYLLTAFVLVVATVLVYMDKLSGETFMTLIMANLAIYGVGNVASKVANRDTIN